MKIVIIAFTSLYFLAAGVEASSSSQVHTTANVNTKSGGVIEPSEFSQLGSSLNFTQLFASLLRASQNKRKEQEEGGAVESSSSDRHQDQHKSDSNSNDDNNNSNQYQCRTYLAPSTIPGAGLGMFAGMAFKEGDEVTPGDAVVPIRDIAWHNSADDGFTNEFLWDEYVWSGHSFKYMAEPLHSLKAASFGIGAVPNCFFPLLNVEDSGSTVKHDYANLERDSPGIGAFTPFHDRQSHANRDIEVGMEIFVDYGYPYFEGSREDIFGLIPFLDDFDTADNILKRYQQTRNRIRARVDRRLHQKSCPSSTSYTTTKMKKNGIATTNQCRSNCTTGMAQNITLSLQSDLFALTHNVMAAFPTRALKALPDNDNEESSSSAEHQQQSTIDALLENGGTAYKDYSRSIRDVDFLKENGLCLDHLVSKPSTIPEAGRGAFATTDFSAGESVAPLPLIHIPQRSILNVYAEDSMLNRETGRLFEDDLTHLVHSQMLLNYCMGHRDSTLLLCNYGVVSSLVNHAPTATAVSREEDDGFGSGQTANVKIVWSDKITAHPEWRDMPIDEWAYNYQTGLGFEYVATKDIAEGEEILVDYGTEWQEAWEEHVSNWKPVTRLVDQLNSEIDSMIPTVEEWKWSMGDPNINNNAVNLWCRNEYRDMQKLPTASNDAYPCKIISRDNDKSNSDPVYTAEIVMLHQGDEDEEKGECWEEFDEVLWAVPRDALAYGGLYEMHDTREYSQPWTFRHDMRIPDDIMPEAWKNLLVDENDGTSAERSGTDVEEEQ